MFCDYSSRNALTDRLYCDDRTVEANTCNAHHFSPEIRVIDCHVISSSAGHNEGSLGEGSGRSCLSA